MVDSSFLCSFSLNYFTLAGITWGSRSGSIILALALHLMGNQLAELVRNFKVQTQQILFLGQLWLRHFIFLSHILASERLDNVQSLLLDLGVVLRLVILVVRVLAWNLHPSRNLGNNLGRLLGIFEVERLENLVLEPIKVLVVVVLWVRLLPLNTGQVFICLLHLALGLLEESKHKLHELTVVA